MRILGSNTRSRRIRLWHNFWSVHLLHRGKESFEGQRQTPLSPNYCKDLSFATKPQFAGSWHPPLPPPWLDNIYIVVGGGQKERGRRDLLARRDTGIVSSPGLTGVSQKMWARYRNWRLRKIFGFLFRILLPVIYLRIGSTITKFQQFGIQYTVTSI